MGVQIDFVRWMVVGAAQLRLLGFSDSRVEREEFFFFEVGFWCSYSRYCWISEAMPSSLKSRHKVCYPDS